MLQLPRPIDIGRLCAVFCLIAIAPLAGAAAFDLQKVEAGVYKVYTWRLTAKKGMGSGTAFLVSGHRTLITNYHVVDNGEKFFVGYRSGQLGKLVEARVIERRAPTDLAVLEAYEDLPGDALALADYEPEKLANVVTVGFPGAADVKEDPTVHSLPELLQAMREPSGFDATITPGTVSRIYSATNAPLSEQQVLNARTVQHNAAINPGNSGGPLFDACSAVIGVNSFFAKGAQGVFFSIHAAEVTRLLNELKIPYRRSSGPCHLASLTSGGGPLLPMLVAASALLAVAALVFALNKSKPFDVLRRYAGRLGVGRKGTPPAAAPAPAGWVAVCDVVSLLPVGGGGGHLLEGGRALTVGRSKGCEIVLNDDTVSNTHARVAFSAKDQWVTVSDLGSSNGTFLNGERISSAEARIGDELRFGTTEFRLAAGAPPAPTRQGGAPSPAWMLSGFDPAGRAVQFELRPSSGADASWTLGRDRARAQLVIDDSSVSGAHAQFSYLPAQGLSLRDLGSTNGTRVDGKDLGTRAVVLSDLGHEIAFGTAKLRLSRLLA